jgi:hypothetical protein
MPIISSVRHPPGNSHRKLPIWCPDRPDEQVLGNRLSGSGEWNGRGGARDLFDLCIKLPYLCNHLPSFNRILGWMPGTRHKIA